MIQKTQNKAVRSPPHWLRDTHYPQKFALTSATSCGRLVGIVRSRTKATELLFPDTIRPDDGLRGRHMLWFSKKILVITEVWLTVI
jgi:hypothetical protein